MGDGSGVRRRGINIGDASALRYGGFHSGSGSGTARLTGGDDDDEEDNFPPNIFASGGAYSFSLVY